MLDVAPVTIGAACQVGSRVQFLTATEPRRMGWESAAPIVLGDVTRDLPAGVVATGVPARVLREIGDRDRIEVPER